MNKEELVTVIWSKLEGVTKDEVRTFLATFLDSIAECMVNCNELKLRDFGKFKITERKPHMVIHPVTKEKVVAPRTRTIRYIPSQSIKDRLNGKHH